MPISFFHFEDIFKNNLKTLKLPSLLKRSRGSASSHEDLTFLATPRRVEWLHLPRQSTASVFRL